MDTVTAIELKTILSNETSVMLVDVRTVIEYREVRVNGAINIPLDQLDLEKINGMRGPDSNEPVYFICQVGGRSKKACLEFERAGFPNAINVTGGTKACVDAGLVCDREKNVVSLERQSQVAYGSLVLAGVALGQLINPWWLLLTVAAGGLMLIAGATQICVVSGLIARLPWNRSTKR